MIRVRLTITGRVQGVFFRSHACKKALELGLTGWVANNADGSVMVVMEGEENLVRELIDWCHSGPSTAQVEKVTTQHEQPSGGFEGFTIRY